MKAWRLAAGILLVTLTLWPARPVYARAPQQVWVDDDYCSACRNDGHAWNIDAFSTISAGLRAAAPGATVNVRPGRYQEDLTIAQPVRLVAERPGSVLLSPRQAEATVTVAANDVTIDGLDVTGGTQAAILAVGPDFQRRPIRGLTIRRNVVRGGLFGIAVNIDPTWNYGTLPAQGIEISGNDVSGCTRAIYVYNARASISRNTVSQLAPEGIGIYSSQGSVSRIETNTVRADSPNSRAIYILDNEGTQVDRNSLIGTSDVLTPTTAITLYGFTDLQVSNNTVEGFYWGTNAYTGGTARVEYNTFRNTAAWAISFGTAITTTQVTVANNTISGSYSGLKLDDDGGYGLQAAVYGNAFTDNVVGVQLAASVAGNDVALHGNSLCGNLKAGLRSDSESPIDARENWWGSNDGPSPAGTGDRAEGAGTISVSPWVRLRASTTNGADGRTTIRATLASEHYRLSGRYLIFATNRGTFADASSSWATSTDANGEAQAVLTLDQGQRANVYIGSACGPILSLNVSQPRPGLLLPFRLPPLLP